MNDKKQRVPEKYMRRRRIFVLIIAILLIAIVAVVATMCNPKKGKDADDTVPESEVADPEEPEEQPNRRLHETDPTPSEDEEPEDILGENPDGTAGDDTDGTSEGDPWSDPAEEDTPGQSGDGQELEENVNLDNLSTTPQETGDVVEVVSAGADFLYGSVSPKADVSPNKPPSAKKTVPKETDWRLLLVNGSNKLPDDFSIQTVKVDNHPIDSRIENPLVSMIMAAKADGINLTIVSGYRSVATQKNVYNNKMKEYLNRGVSKEKAKLYTEMYIHVPGYSEHHTGLAVDILTPEHSQLLPSYAETAAAKWLKENAADYGFILRYPEGKEKVTGIAFEPWHYRYVGQAVAQDIMSMGCTLEEYLYIKEKDAQKQAEETTPSQERE